MLKKFLVPALLVSAVCLPCVAQTVYESKDKAGPVFTDRPSPGGKALDLPPPNVIQTPALPKQGAAPAPAPAPYASLAIASLENEGTIHSNTGDFTIRVRSAPALRAAAGDRIRVKFDGALLASKYSTGTVNIRATDWPAAADENAQHTLQVAIVDRKGNTLIESAPVRFYVRRATAGHRGR